LVVAVGGFVDCVVAVGGIDVLVADLGVTDGIEVTDGDQIDERVVVEAVPHTELVGLPPGVEDIVVNPVATVGGTTVSVPGVSESSIDDNREGVTVTGSGSKGVLEIVGEGDDTARSPFTESESRGG
jgi:hypothetical protein